MKPIFMKNIILLFFLIISTISYSQTITRGTEQGEIYFLGPTHTTNGLYHSTDFGQTAICVDSINSISSIAADKTPGGIYGFKYPSNLYYSGNYGNANSWQLKNDDINRIINTGVLSGHIFVSCGRHSEDYGITFINHTLNGYFGSVKRVALDNLNDSNGYVITTKVTVADTNYLFRTSDKFENVELIHNLTFHWNEIIALARGFNAGEVFMFNFTRNNLWVSYDYFDSMAIVDIFNIPDFYAVGMEGGNIAGELYLLYAHSNQTQQNRNTYIFHSTDYGVTFDVYHPFAKGNEPVIANFSTVNKESFLLSEVEFDNFSIGDLMEYQWDFENDGNVDSYEEFPVHYYQDTGYYSVRLTVVGQDSSNTVIKENYVHVIDTSTFINQPDLTEVKIFPNPFSKELIILVDNQINMCRKIEIYNNRGEIVNEISPVGQNNVWDGRNNAGQKCTSGIYYLKINHSVYKVIIAK